MGFFWTRDAVSAEDRIASFVEDAQFASSVVARSASLMPRTAFDDGERSAQDVNVWLHAPGQGRSPDPA